MENNQETAKTAKKSIKDIAWGRYKKEWKKILPTSFNFFMVMAIVLAVGYFFPATLYITIPFVLVPFLFAYEMSSSYIKKGSPMNNQTFSRFYMSYYAPNFFGCYRIVYHFFLSLLWGLLASFIVACVYYLIAMNVSDSFVTAINYVMEQIEAGGNINNLSQYLSSNTAFLYYSNTVTAVQFGVGFYFFMHYMSYYGLSPYIHMIVVGDNVRAANAIMVGGIRLVKKDFWKDYYSALWPLLVLMIVGFLGGGALAMLWSGSVYDWLLIGFAGAGIFLTPFIPYYFYVMESLSQKYKGAFAKYSISLAQRTLKELEDAQRLSEGEAQALKKSIDDAKKASEAIDAQDNEGKDDDDKDEDHTNHHDKDEYGGK
ncbi:MAG: hypothetical protein LKF75_03635 [Bacilli bacterium]|nr:hypothetical protein [Bacilli bacterium]MCH4228773.1 hypothetical protein [Bacilli bacterium]MCH4278367.1 hypothetical protein [Bacilli bacterium]MCI2055070.1 hypothetical protein [Bacilli bacterium]